MTLPNFFIVGAAKSGTTSLYKYLKSHPQIYMSPIKEPNYYSKDFNPDEFSEDYLSTLFEDVENFVSGPMDEEIHIAHVRERKNYEALFKNVDSEIVVGEISNSYLVSEVAAQLIYDDVPDAKIVMLLRDPVDRAYSNYKMDIQMGRVSSKSIVDEVKKNMAKDKRGWGISRPYIEAGLYYEQVKRYLDIFPRENVKIYLYDDLKSDKENLLKDLLSFLGVDESLLKYDSKRYAQSIMPRYRFINHFAFKSGLKETFKKYLPKSIADVARRVLFKSSYDQCITGTEKDFLFKYFQRDIGSLSGLINRDLSSWIV